MAQGKVDSKGRKIKFIRKNGKVIPIRDNGKGPSKAAGARKKRKSSGHSYTGAKFDRRNKDLSKKQKRRVGNVASSSMFAATTGSIIGGTILASGKGKLKTALGIGAVLASPLIGLTTGAVAATTTARALRKKNKKRKRK